jgi:hypothetical protein
MRKSVRCIAFNNEGQQAYTRDYHELAALFPGQVLLFTYCHESDGHVFYVFEIPENQ